MVTGRARLSRCLGQFHALCAPVSATYLHVVSHRVIASSDDGCGGWLRGGRLLVITTPGARPISVTSIILPAHAQALDIIHDNAFVWP
jgi:hypothetical protein